METIDLLGQEQVNELEKQMPTMAFSLNGLTPEEKLRAWTVFNHQNKQKRESKKGILEAACKNRNYYKEKKQQTENRIYSELTKAQSETIKNALQKNIPLIDLIPAIGLEYTKVTKAASAIKRKLKI